MKRRDAVILDNKFFDYGIISYEDYVQHQPKRKQDWIRSILVFVFPYQNQNQTGRYLTAKFAYGEDYHIVVKEKLTEIAKTLELNRYEVMVDVSFLDEKLCASLAGIGTIGKNNLIISKKFGTFVVIGEIVTDEVFDYYDQPIFSLCNNCSLCIDACPTKALDNGFDRKKCLSYLTQGKSKDFDLYNNLTDICFGCDICQDVCYHNEKTNPYFDNFNFNQKSVIDINDLKKLDSETFLKHYHDKTFNWIGYLKMLRNIIVLDANNNNISLEDLNYFQNLYKDELWFYNHLEYLKGKLKHGNR